MDSSQDFKSWQEKLQAALVSTTKDVNRIASEDIAFQRSVDPAVAEQLDDTTARILRLSSGLLKSATKGTDQKAPKLEDIDAVEVQWRGVVDMLDSMLEKTDTCLDEYTGLVKKKDTSAFESFAMPKNAKQTGRLDRSLSRANIIKPQNSFEQKPDNQSNGPWKPLLTQKPHATLPLESSLGTFVDENQNTQYDYTFYLPLTLHHIVHPVGEGELGEEEERTDDQRRRMTKNRLAKLRRLGSVRDTDNNPRYKHPYETEILNSTYPATAYQKRDPIRYPPIESTAATWVDTFDGVLAMLEELKVAQEIAIDLEHHDFRTYTGLLSLMQISTREKDWVVDTLRPWRHRLEILNEVFADPKIIKVFHGAFMDMIWLQRDLGLYVVGLFDTFHASEALGLARRSLAYLLKTYVDFDADKKYQLADWRIRPLTAEMLFYARSDTHFLLYVYDKLRNELIERSDAEDPDPQKNLIQWVVQKSKETSLLRYDSVIYDHENGHGTRGWFSTLSKLPYPLSAEQFSVYKAVHGWRDQMARREDESPFFIMNNQSVLEIAKAMPADVRGLSRLIYNMSHTLKVSLNELLVAIKASKAEGASGPTTLEFFHAHTAKANGDAPASEAPKSDEISGPKSESSMPHVSNVRSEASQLWGPVPMSSLWEALSLEDPLRAGPPIAISTGTFLESSLAAVPERRLAEEVLKPAAAFGGRKPQSTTVVDSPAEEFTLKAGRQSRKGGAAIRPGSDTDSSEDEAGGGVAVSPDEEPPDSHFAEDAPRQRHKRESNRKARQQQKRKVKAAEAAAIGSSGDAMDVDSDEDSQPFDYSTANSVLHAAKGGVESSKAFNPYVAKTTAEGPKGARRMHSEKAGKTATFKK